MAGAPKNEFSDRGENPAVSLQLVSGSLGEPGSAAVAITSLPWPRSAQGIPAAPNSQVVPLHGVDAPLQRFLLLTQGDAGLTSTLDVRIRPDGASLPGAGQDTSLCQVEVMPVREGTEPYWHREDEARITVGQRSVGIRLGLQLEAGPSWWQWTRAEKLWGGPVADAWRIAGHIVAHTLEDTPQVSPELTMFEATARYSGQQVAASLFVIVFHSGVLQISAHFKNNDFMVPSEFVPGLPLIQFNDLQGAWPAGRLNDARQPLGDPSADTLDFGPMAGHFSDEYPARMWSEGEGNLNIVPFGRVEILTNKTKDNRFLYLGEPDQQGLPEGVARSVRFSLGLNGTPAPVGRYQVPASWYGRCGVLNGREQEPVIGSAHQWAAAPRELLYQYSHRGGFDTGRVWRYLRRDQRSGVPQIDDAEWEGGVVQALWYDSYLFPEHACRRTIVDQGYHFADVAVHHGHGMVRCHGYNTVHMPLPMMRVGGLVLTYLETGDPYLLETARAVAGAFMRVDEANSPRHSIGRDAYPLAGLMTLYDTTGDRIYLDYGRKASMRLLATQTLVGGFSGQGNVGVLGGNSNKWNPVDIFMFSGLIGPIGMLEWAIRDDRHPQGLDEGLSRWYDLVLSLQHEEGWWPQNEREGATSHPMLPAGLFFSLAAYHRLTGDSRGLAALRRYLDYALGAGEFVLGTHAFLAVLYASFFEQEAATAGLENTAA